MTPVEELLAKLTRLRVDRARGDPAPHKPLLLLALIGQVERGMSVRATLPLSPELAYAFFALWRIVAHRRKQRPRVELPFHHLSSDGLWSVRNASGDLSNDYKATRYAVLTEPLRVLLSDAAFREAAKRLLIRHYFSPQERIALYEAAGLAQPDDEAGEELALSRFTNDPLKIGRDTRFRLTVVTAYEFTCALTGYRLTTISAGSLVDAAHIHPFSDSRNNDARNGLALSKNSHWAFDQGLWGITDNYMVVIASDKFAEDIPHGKPLTAYHGDRLRLPKEESLWPDPVYIAWHRSHRMKA